MRSHLIYQCWNGPLPEAARVSRKMMAAYAGRIGADYRFDHDCRYYPQHFKYFDMLRPTEDPEFQGYDAICIVDLDVYPVPGLAESIFDEPVGDLGMAEEPDQPAMREIPVVGHITTDNDNRWAERFFPVGFPRDAVGRLRVFNSGVVVFTEKGIGKFDDKRWSFGEYEERTKGLPQFYQWDQHYLHAMAFVLELDFTVLPTRWNRQLHHMPDGSVYDKREADTCFVHVQMRGANEWTEEQILETVAP